MTQARSGDADAALARCADAGWTPGARDVVALLEAWDREPDRRIVRALARGDAGVARRLLEGFDAASGRQRAMRLGVLARIARRIDAVELAPLLERGLRDPEPKVVREAARAIGKGDEAAGAIHEDELTRVSETAALPERRAAVEALGRVGGRRALARLRAGPWEDADLARRAREAVLLIERRLERGTPSAIVVDGELPHAATLIWRGRAGTAALLADQAVRRLGLARDRVTVRDAASIAVRWSADLATAYQVRSALEVGLEFPLAPGRTLAQRIVATLHEPALVAALTAWTTGVSRFRLSFPGGGHRRALVRHVAQQLADTGSRLLNDTREVAWTVEVHEDGEGRVLCLPRGADRRFAHRVADVPAASHPTLAAALAWAAEPRRGELVWDPFCGSGLELIECALLQPGLHLHGSDLDPRAIAAARANLAAAPLEIASSELVCVDARHERPRRGAQVPTLIVCNPPMGRRVAGDGSLRALLIEFVAHAAAVLAPAGRLVWLSPLPRLTASAGRRAGLAVHTHDEIDMGGFAAALQVLRKRR